METTESPIATETNYKELFKQCINNLSVIEHVLDSYNESVNGPTDIMAAFGIESEKRKISSGNKKVDTAIETLRAFLSVEYVKLITND